MNSANNFVSINVQIVALEMESARRQRMKAKIIGQDVPVTINFDGDVSLKAKTFLGKGSLIALFGTLDSEGERLVVSCDDFTIIQTDEDAKPMVAKSSIDAKSDEDLSKKFAAMNPERI